MLKKLSFLLMGLIALSGARGQSLLDFKPFDTSAYVFKLDKAQMDFVATHNGIVDTSFLFTHLHKTFSRNCNYNDSLANGNYIVANVDQALVQYQFLNKASFELKHRIIGNDVILFVKDKKSRANISTADIKLNDTPIPYNEGYGGYVLDKNSVSPLLLAQYKVLLKVTVGAEYLVTHYMYNKPYQPKYRGGRLFKGHQSLTSSGYVITDKPVYRPGDTLRLKAFLSNPLTGKPQKKRANFYIVENGQNFSHSKKLKAVSRGAFVYEWKIPDTLKIDRTFQMGFWYKKHRNTFTYSSSFYLENYVLGTTQYDASLSKTEFFPNEDIRFRVQATDANGFPLQGTMIHYRLSLNSVQDFFGDSLTLSANKRNNLYEHDTLYPYENNMELKIPSSCLPNVDASYNIEVTMTDPATFEQKHFNLFCARLQKTEKLLVYQEEDSLFVRYLFNGRDTANSYQLRLYSNGDSLSSLKITTPYRAQLSPYATQAAVTDKYQQSTNINLGFNFLDISKVSGERSADSIRIRYSFPFEEAIYYRILKNDKVLQQGKTKRLDFKMADKSKDAYTILFTSNINNAIESNFYRITYVPPLHKIKLKSTLPAQAFPGQKLQVNIEATDCYNKPLKDINIAAYAVNKQFNERYVRPSITVPEPFKDLVAISQEPITEQITLVPNTFQNQVVLNAKNFSRFNLLKNEYYVLRYPNKDYSHIVKKIQSPVSEFALSVTLNHVAYTPKYILVDGQPVYISDLRGFPYSFQTTAGKHQISFRFSNKTITLNDIAFAAHTKNWLGFNLDSISPKSKQLVIVDSLPIAQPTDAEKTILYSSLLLTNQFGYDTLQVLSGTQSIFKSNRNIYRQAIALNIDGDNFYAFGPINSASTAVVKLNAKEFNLKISSEYAHYYNDITQEFTTKTRGPIKGAIFGFAEEQISDMHLASMQVYDSVKPQPDQIHLDFNPDANQANRQNREPEYVQNYNSGGPAYFRIFFKSTDTAKFVKAIWLINKKQPEYSDYRQIAYYGGLTSLHKNGAEGTYDVYFLMSNKQLLVLRDHTFKNGDDFYITTSKFGTEVLNNDRLSQALKIYTDLTRLHLLPFYFPPEESNENIKESKDEKRQKTYLHGYVTDESLQPMANVMVLAEVNGKFMYGAMTNNVGEYEILDMLPGSYQLKFYSAGFQMKTFATRFFKAGYSYELSSSLKSLNLQRPVLETIQKDFRFMAFNGDSRKNLMKLNVYDKDTREAIRNFTVTLREISNESAEKTLVAKEDLELAFLPQTKVYNLEIACKGYVPVVFRNVRFCKNSFYALYLFMLNEKDNQWQKKKEYDLQMQYYSATEEIGARNANLAYNDERVYLATPYSAGPAEAGAYAYSINSKELESLNVVTLKKFKHKVSAPAQHGVSDVVEVDQEEFDDKGQALQEVEIVSRSELAKLAPENMINQVVNMADLSQTRSNFTDVGFWQPNLITNKKGQVNFEIRLPDNITTWKSTVLAMGDHHLHGIDTIDIKAYKPLQVAALVPAYMWKGDKVWARAKFTNLTKEPKIISASIRLNNAVLRTATFTVKNDVLDSALLDANVLGNLQYKAGLQFEEKYKDEEQRNINVYNPAFRFFTNQSFSMDRDSTYRVSFAKDTKGEIILNNSLYEKIVEEINQLNNYEYSCVEQTSSQLKALLCKEKINRVLLSKENLNPSINKLTRQLENYQNKNGTWGWWKAQSVNWRMTIYAVEALGKAKSSGYNNNSFSKGVKAIKDNFASLAAGDKVYAYSVLQTFGMTDDNLKKQLQTIKAEELSSTDKLYYYKIKEAAGDKVSYNDLYAVYLELNSSMARPYYGNFFYEPRTNLLEAYNLFSSSPNAKEWIDLFKRKLLNGQLDYNLNTYAKAALIEALTASTGYSDNKPITAEVTINDTIKVKTFPYRLKIARTDYKLQHKDASVFVNTAEEKFTDAPASADSLFKVATNFTQSGKTTNTIKAGVTCQMNITVDAYRSYDYVMIEIPVPSGMRFVTKSQQGNCSIEYYPNKVVVFYQHLNMQQHQLSFEMMPVFKGSFVWPAAKCSLMYYPYLFGNNANQGLEVR